MKQTKITSLAVTKSFQQKEIECAEVAATVCGVLSVVGLASAASLEWIKALEIEPATLAMYQTNQLHAAAQVSSLSLHWIAAFLVIGSIVFYLAHKVLAKSKKH